MMVRYLAILNFTDRGIRDVHESITRANEFRAMVETADGKVIQVYWAVGECDGVIIFEVPDERTGASLMLRLCNHGFVRSRTLRVYDETEFLKILSVHPQE
jgi:uncharacterized protein with GYD domain